MKEKIILFIISLTLNLVGSLVFAYFVAEYDREKGLYFNTLLLIYVVFVCLSFYCVRLA